MSAGAGMMVFLSFPYPSFSWCGLSNVRGTLSNPVPVASTNVPNGPCVEARPGQVLETTHDRDRTRRFLLFAVFGEYRRHVEPGFAIGRSAQAISLLVGSDRRLLETASYRPWPDAVRSNDSNRGPAD